MAKICKILLVEDQREIQELLHELFASEGYRFVIVGDGAAMRRTLETDAAIDIVVIDVLLPGGVDGLTLAREAAARGVPVILVTGDHAMTDKLTSSGHRYLLKPFSLAAFIALIETVLEETRAHCERDAAGAARHRASAGASASAASATSVAAERGAWRHVKRWLRARRGGTARTPRTDAIEPPPQGRAGRSEPRAL